MGTSDREILQSPVEIGTTETKSYSLAIPTSWGSGSLSSPTVTVKNKKGATIAGAVSGSPTVGGTDNRSVIFTLLGSGMVKGYDYDVFVSVGIGTDTQVARGVWQCRV